MNLDNFCVDEFWNRTLSWDTDVPQLSKCFCKVALTIVPNLFILLILAPISIIIIRNSKSLRNISNYSCLRIPIHFILIIHSLLYCCIYLYEILYESNSTALSDLFASVSNLLVFTALFIIYIMQYINCSNANGPCFVAILLVTACSAISYILGVPSLYQGKESLNTGIVYFYMLYILCSDEIYKADPTDSDSETPRSSALINSRLSRSSSQEISLLSDDSCETTSNSSLKVDRKLKLSPLEYCTFPSKLTYFWYTKLIRLASEKEIELDEIYESPKKIKADTVIEKFNTIYNKEVQRIKESNADSLIRFMNKNSKKCSIEKFNSLSLLKVIGKTYWPKIILFNILKTLGDIATFAIPLLLNVMINFVSNPNERSWHIIPVVIALIIINLLKVSLINHNNMEAFAVAINLKTCLSSLVFNKAFKLSNSGKLRTSMSKWMNLFDIDSSRFIDFAPYFVYIWSSPLQLLLGTSLLYYLLGYSAFVFMAVVFVVMIIQYILNRLRNSYTAKEVEINDERMKLITETILGIKIIKLSGYEQAFQDLITKERNKQANFSRKIYLLKLILGWIFSSLSPFLVFNSTICIYLFVIGGDLTPQKAFVAILTFKILSYPLEEFPSLISNLITIKISLKRLSAFLREDELEDYVKRKFDQKYAVKISNKAKFAWTTRFLFLKNNLATNLINPQPENEECELKDIELDVLKNSFTCVIGKVGAGKSSLLSAILGEMHLVENDSVGNKGIVNISGDQHIKYVAQQPFIQNDSFKNNILFGTKFNQEQYESVIQACALEPDLKQFEAGDETEIGEKGINLSGGQKQRVNLARACYSSLSKSNKNQIILLDDPLSAVDANVGKHLCEHVLSSKTGILKDTTRILVTNQLNQLSDLHVDQIILLKEGRIELKCTYDDLLELEKSGQLEDYELKLSQNEKSSEKSVEEDKMINPLDNKIEKLNDKRLIKEEKSYQGKVQFKNHLIYLKYFGLFNFLLLILFIISENIFQVLARVYLATWTNKNEHNATNQETERENLFNYIYLSTAEMISSLIACSFMLFGVANTIKLFHKNLLHKTLRSPLPSFFDVTQIGPILQRFSKDILVIDKTLPESIQGLLSQFLRLFAIMCLVVYKQPYSCIFFAFIILIYYFIMKNYVNTSRQLKRHESVTNSILCSFLSESFAGISTIKAYNKTTQFQEELKLKIEDNNRCQWYFSTGYRWLKSTLCLLANLIIVVISFRFIFNGESSNAGDAGLLFSYTITLTDHLSFLIRFLGTFEANSVSLERINQYSQNEEEDEWIKENNRPPSDWPKNGQIEFHDYSARYREGTNLVLKDLNFKIDGSDKIGVVGRTGAGKSTITLSLFRIIEPASGRILIDNVDISEIGLHDLRSKLSIIPQDPVLFTGTIRFNLDPFEKYSDKEIYEALEHAHLKEYVNSLEDGIEHKIAEGGENLSVGQRQLVCLARALLRKSKILVLDEATASVDFATDELVQKTIRSEFKNCTTITIAHRLNTVLDSTKILVLEKGELKEYEQPQRLLEDPTSLFYALAAKAKII